MYKGCPVRRKHWSSASAIPGVPAHQDYDEYGRRRDQIWPELSAVLREHGVGSCSIYLDARRSLLFAHVELESIRALERGSSPGRISATDSRVVTSKTAFQRFDAVSSGLKMRKVCGFAARPPGSRSR